MYVKFEVFLHTKKICKKCHISKFLAEVGFSNSKAYLKTTHSIEEITHANINYYKKFELNITELDKLVPIMYWLPNLPKTHIGARLIVASKSCSTEPLSDAIYWIFKMILNTIESFHKKAYLIQAARNSDCSKLFAKFQ